MTLPITLDPEPDESLTSLVRRTTTCLHLDAAGLRRYTRAKIDWESLRNLLTNRQVTAIARVLGIDPRDLKRTTLATYARAFPLVEEVVTGRRPVQSFARTTWYWTNTTQACLPCLAERPDVWHLSWHLPWTLLCPRHGQYLATECPICGERLHEGHRCRRRRGGPWADIEWRTQISARPGRRRTRPTEASRLLDDAIRQALSGEPVVTRAVGPLHAAQYLRAMRSLAGFHEHVGALGTPTAGKGRRAVTAAPRGVGERVVHLTFASDVLASTPAEASGKIAARLHDLPEGASRRGWVADHTLPVPALTSLIDHALTPSASLGYRRIAPGSHQPSHVPQLVPLHVWTAVGPLTTSGPTLGRCFASMALVKAISGATWTDAGGHLGLPEEMAHRVARSGKRALVATDSEYFAALQADLPSVLALDVDWRARERRVADLITTTDWLANVIQTLDCTWSWAPLIREKVWLSTCRGHPRLAPGNRDLDPTARSRLATKRQRWTTSMSDALDLLLAGEGLTDGASDTGQEKHGLVPVSDSSRAVPRVGRADTHDVCRVADPGAPRRRDLQRVASRSGTRDAKPRSPSVSAAVSEGRGTS